MHDCRCLGSRSPGSYLGRRCLEAILAEPGWKVRVLTKNAAVVRDFDLIEKYKDRVLVGLSLTGTPDQAEVLKAIEPYASSIRERMAALARLTPVAYGLMACCARSCRP